MNAGPHEAHTNLVAMLLTRAAERPDLLLGTVDEQVKLPDALARATGGADYLTGLDLAPGARVAIVATSCTDYLVVWMACLLARVPVALINPTYPPELLFEMLENLDPAVVLTDIDDASFTGQRLTMPLSVAATWRGSDPSATPGVAADRYDVVSFMHTSGTTGVPKFCAQTHEYFLRLGEAMASKLGLTATDRMLAPLPLFHINPMGYGIIGALTAGADALTVRKFSARGFWPTVRDQSITALALHAPPVEILKRATTAKDAAGHQVRTMFYADGEFMRRFGVNCAVSGYGSTEAAGVSHLHAWTLGEEIPADASRYGGHPRIDVEAALHDSGEIMVRERVPGTLFAGYFANGELNSARDADGWFSTGDLGRLDEDGGLVFIERAAESIRVKGEFVPIPYVEERLGAIESLRDLALWKRPGEIVDDEVVLYVVADQVPLEDIRRVSAELPMFMRPSHVAQIPSMPRDAAAGKVQRRLLHDQAITSWTTL